MKYPNQIQVALLFDRPGFALERLLNAFQRIEGMNGRHYNLVEATGSFFRLFGLGTELMVTMEAINQPAAREVFTQALDSPITSRFCRDMVERVVAHRAHLLINVSHGVLGNLTETMDFLRAIDFPREGATLRQFRERIDTLTLLTRLAQEEQPATVVHWTQSNQLFAADLFEAMPKEPPDMIHVHPWLFGGGSDDQGRALAGFRTFGARHFIGGEILVEPSPVPWLTNFSTALTFLRIATADNGYIIPDGDLFGPDDRSCSYRVDHLPADEGDVPLYRLTPMMVRDHDYRHPDYIGHGERAFDDRNAPDAQLPANAEERDALIADWRERRGMAEKFGAKFEVRSRASPAPNPRPPFGRRPFGRKV